MRDPNSSLISIQTIMCTCFSLISFLIPSFVVNVGTGGLSCISAAGPFTLMDSLDLSPLLDLLRVVETQKPKLLILVSLLPSPSPPLSLYCIVL